MIKIDAKYLDKRFAGCDAKIVNVRREVIEGVPQLVIDIAILNGNAVEFASGILDQQSARDLTAAWGPHPVVEEFFRSGAGLQ